MTTSVTRPTTSYVDHTVVGTPDQVAAVIRRHYQVGTFIAMAAPRPLAPGDPRIRVQIRLTAPATTAGRLTPATVHSRPASAAAARRPHPAGNRTRRRLGVGLTITTVIIGLMFTVGYLVARATAEALTNAAATVAGFAAIAAVAAALLRGGSGGKRHCPGCD